MTLTVFMHPYWDFYKIFLIITIITSSLFITKKKYFFSVLHLQLWLNSSSFFFRCSLLIWNSLKSTISDFSCFVCLLCFLLLPPTSLTFTEEISQMLPARSIFLLIRKQFHVPVLSSYLPTLFTKHLYQNS